MACFIVCWLPFFSIYLFDGVVSRIVLTGGSERSLLPPSVVKIAFWLGYCNSTLVRVHFRIR